jgi:hypothetical protein
MMFRRTCVLMLALVALVGIATDGQAQKKASKGIKLGETFEGEMKGDKFAFFKGIAGNIAVFPKIPLFKTRGSTTPKDAYIAEVPVALKAGQKVTITAAVKGDDRKLMIIVLDRTGEIVGHSEKFTPKTAELVIEEANATGLYKIGVFSDKSGAFTLRARTPSTAKESSKETELDEKQLKAKIKALKKELADLEEKLEALQEKKEKSLSK